MAASNPCDTLPLPSYSHDFNVGVADELRTVTRDYTVTRDAIRECRSVK